MSTSTLYLFCREFPGVPRGDFLLAKGARCSRAEAYDFRRGDCSPSSVEWSSPGITFEPEVQGVPGDYLRATGARCSRGYLRATALGFQGGRLQIPKSNAARRSFFEATPLKKMHLFCKGSQKKSRSLSGLCVFGTGGEMGIRTPEPIRVSTVSRPPRSTDPAYPFISGAGFVVWI